MSEEDMLATIRTDCWNRALDAFGYSYIYKIRIESIEPWMRWSKVAGIVGPVFVGGIVGTYSDNNKLISGVLLATGLVSVVQLVISTYLTVSGSDENITLFSKLTAEYSILNSEFELLARFPLSDLSEYRKRYEVLVERERVLSRNGSLSDKELRKAMRSGLRNYRRNCAGCDLVPTSIESTDCNVCGNF